MLYYFDSVTKEKSYAFFLDDGSAHAPKRVAQRHNKINKQKVLRLTVAFDTLVCLFDTGKFHFKIFEMQGDRKRRIGKSVGVVIPYSEIEYYPGSSLEWLVETTIMLKNI